jgi:hypothetical protein
MNDYNKCDDGDGSSDGDALNIHWRNGELLAFSRINSEQGK